MSSTPSLAILIIIIFLSGCAIKEKKSEEVKPLNDVSNVLKNDILDKLIELNNNSYINDTKLDLPAINDNRLPIYYFYSPICPFCNIINPKVDSLALKYNDRTRLLRYNVLVQADLDVYNNFTLTHNVRERVVPLVFVNNTYLSGMFDINNTLESLIIKNLNKSS